MRRHQHRPHQLACPFLLRVVLVRPEAGTIKIAKARTANITAAVVVKDTFAGMNLIAQVLHLSQVQAPTAIHPVPVPKPDWPTLGP